MAAKQRLVVIGNGMAGARAVEEILDRGGAERFAITMIGDEPHGNYNRISLSNVLAGSEDTSGIYLNPLDWYASNDITLHSGVKVTKIDRFARTVTAGYATTLRYDNPIIAIVVEDRDGDGERLDAELERSLSAYSDPWLEGGQPVTTNQFRSVVAAD